MVTFLLLREVENRLFLLRDGRFNLVVGRLAEEEARAGTSPVK